QRGHHVRIVLAQPRRVEARLLPAEVDHRLAATAGRVDDREEDAAAVAAGLVAEHLDERVLAGREPRCRIPQPSDRAGLPIGQLAEAIAEESEGHGGRAYSSAELQPAAVCGEDGDSPIAAAGAVR